MSAHPRGIDLNPDNIDPDPFSPASLATAIDDVVAEYLRGEPLDVHYLRDIAQYLRHPEDVPVAMAGDNVDVTIIRPETKECPDQGIGDHDCVEHEEEQQ